MPIPCQVAPGPLGSGLVGEGASPMVKGPCGGPNPNVTFQGTYNTTAGPLPASTQNWGTTAVAIQSNFAANLYANFEANPALDAMFANMDSGMLARMSTELAANDTAGYTPYILARAATQLSAANLSKLRSAFGPTLVNAAIAYAPAAVQSAYNSTPAAAAVPISEYYYSLGYARLVELDPADGMFGTDVWLLAYTSQGYGNLAQSTALAVRYLQTHVPTVTGVHRIVWCNSVASCIALALTAVQGAQLAAPVVGQWVNNLSQEYLVTPAWNSYWNQWKGYIPGVTVQPPGDVDPPIEGPPTPPPPPEQEGPPTPPPPDVTGPPSPQPEDGGDVTIGGDNTWISPD
jgi:hypothetical protein